LKPHIFQLGHVAGANFTELVCYGFWFHPYTNIPVSCMSSSTYKQLFTATEYIHDDFMIYLGRPKTIPLHPRPLINIRNFHSFITKKYISQQRNCFRQVLKKWRFSLCQLQIFMNKSATFLQVFCLPHWPWSAFITYTKLLLQC
jgi:hypothetical protein